MVSAKIHQEDHECELFKTDEAIAKYLQNAH